MAHRTDGLQEHSIGETYPWAVVGTINEGGTAYYVVNLATNRRDTITYESTYVAHLIAKLVSEGELELLGPTIQWVGEPQWGPRS